MTTSSTIWAASVAERRLTVVSGCAVPASYAATVRWVYRRLRRLGMPVEVARLSVWMLLWAGMCGEFVAGRETSS